MIIKINKKIEYALIVLNHLESQPSDETVTARQISDKYTTPFDTTAKVMQTLSHHDVLKSQQGIKGGYKLNKDLSKYSYIDVYQMIEGKKLTKDCHSTNCSIIETCNISGPISNLNESLIYFFQGISLKDLFQNKTPNNFLKEAING